MFKLIILVFIFIGLIAIDGDYKTKEMQKDYKKFEEVTNEQRRNTTSNRRMGFKR